MKKPGRVLRQAEGTPVHRHPDADRPTRRIPFHELRALVLSLIDTAHAAALEAGELELDDAAQEFEAQPTTFRPKPRGSTPGVQLPDLTRAGTLDALIAELRIAYARQMASALPRRQPRRRTDPVVREVTPPPRRPDPVVREVNPPRPSSNRR